MTSELRATASAVEFMEIKGTRQLITDHTEHCVAEAIQAGDGRRKVRELTLAVARLVTS